MTKTCLITGRRIFVNASHLSELINRTAMASKSSIAKKAHAKAEADFATWLMLAKLGSFDELPSNAQKFLTDYRARLQTMNEADSTVLAVREVYSAYYSEMGGEGAAPEPQARKVAKQSNVVRLQRGRSAAHNATGQNIRKSVPALVIFLGMVALIVTYKFLTH
jgi:hypothetical protein